MKLTNAEVTRLSRLPEPEITKRLLDPKTDLEAIVKKARFLEAESLAGKSPEEADRYEQLIESAVILIPGRKYPEAIL